VLTPRLKQLFVTDPAAHRRLAIRGAAAAFAMAAVVVTPAYVFAAPLITLLFGPAFAAASAPFRVLCIGLPSVFAIWVLHAAAISVNKERLLVKAALTGLAVNVAVNLWAIPRAGGLGAALATVVGELVSLAVLVAGLI